MNEIPTWGELARRCVHIVYTTWRHSGLRRLWRRHRRRRRASIIAEMRSNERMAVRMAVQMLLPPPGVPIAIAKKEDAITLAIAEARERVDRNYERAAFDVATKKYRGVPIEQLVAQRAERIYTPASRIRNLWANSEEQ